MVLAKCAGELVVVLGALAVVGLLARILFGAFMVGWRLL